MNEIISILFLIWFITGIGWFRKDFTVLVGSGMLMMIAGIYLSMFPITTNPDRLLILGLSLMHIAFGFYIIARSTVDYVNTEFNKVKKNRENKRRG